MRLTLDMMNGLPTIIVGIFIYGLIVAGHNQSGFAAALALAVIMLPMIARTTQEVLALVPRTLREGAEALGVGRWRVILGVLLPTVGGAILTATVLAAARVAGETAPQILVNLVAPDRVRAQSIRRPRDADRPGDDLPVVRVCRPDWISTSLGRGALPARDHFDSQHRCARPPRAQPEEDRK